MSETPIPQTPGEVKGHDFDAPGAGRSAAAVIAAVCAFALGALLFLDPLGWHGLDERLRGDPPTAAGEAEDGLWTCPMHPEILQDEPGSCPICGMDLVTVEGAPTDDHAGHSHHGDHVGHGDRGSRNPGTEPDPAAGETSMAGATDDVPPSWTCPMHPEILQHEPGSCPICGMDLVKREDLGAAPADDGPVVSIDPAVVQNMNVRTEAVSTRDIRRDLRAVGYLEVDPKRRVTVTTKYRGWIEKVHVHYVGESVRAGQPLFEIYAPDLVQTQKELLSAARYARGLADAPEDTLRRAEELVAAARTRLGYWDVQDDAVERLLESGEVFRTLTVDAPVSGVVTRRLDGLEGMAAQPGMEMFEIADLRSLWLTAELYEDQVAWIGTGARAEVRLSYFPGERFEGRVRFLEPELRAETRTLGVRVEVPNPDGRLRAGMYAEARFRPEAVAGTLAVPSQAVLRSGQRDLVVVALGEGRFVPRQVLLGHEGEGWVQVVQGLRSGERVVTSAQFLIDSESNLRAAIETLRGSPQPQGPPQAAADGDASHGHHEHGGHGDHAGHGDHQSHAGHGDHAGHGGHQSHEGHGDHAAHEGHQSQEVHGDHAAHKGHQSHEGHGDHAAHGGHQSHEGHGDHAGHEGHQGHESHGDHAGHGDHGGHGGQEQAHGEGGHDHAG
ncbi:MAG: efflux RND transporter periplasmic adaptor subunit [Acidobacteriota bacterium]